MEWYLLLLFFFLSCLFLQYFGTVFCADHVLGAHVPSALAQILHLLGSTEQCWSWMAGGGGELGGAGRAGSIPGQEGAVGSAHPCVLVRGATPGPCTGKCPVEWPEPVNGQCHSMLTGHGACRTCWCSTLLVIWRNSVFSFPSFQEHQLMQFSHL